VGSSIVIFPPDLSWHLRLASGAKRPRKVAGAREIKRPPETYSETARDYSTTLSADRKGRYHTGLSILSTQEWKNIFLTRSG
jgi:hypothetical protein